MADLEGKVVFVTGSTKGIGLAIAQGFVAKGCRVIVHGRNGQLAAQTCLDIKGYASVSGDLSLASDCDAVLAQLAELDPVDLLINNAGIFSVADFFSIDDEEWLRYYQTNVLSVVRLCRGLMPAMLARNSGAIINVASEAGFKPLPQMIHYSMSKTALTGLSRGLAELTKGTKVTVNTLLPGPTWTEGVEEYFAGLAKEESRPLNELISNYFKEHEPNSLIQRFITVEEVADAALFVAKNGAVNGSALRVEGGIIRSI